MTDKKKRFHFSLDRKGLYVRLSVIFSLFFFVPLLGLLYFGFKYDMLGDQLIPAFILLLLASSLTGHVLIRRTFDSIRSASKQINDALSRDLTEFHRPSVSDELQEILQSFHAVEGELRSSFNTLERRTSQLSTLKELSDLCYVTFDSDDLFAVTLERALKLTNSDIGSVLLLEGHKRDAFTVRATTGLGDLIKKGEKVDFASSVAKFAVINKTPLLINDIEKDSRFGRANRSHYATKAFLLMPLRGIRDVFGVLTLSRGSSSTPYTQEDIDILAPFLSNAAFTYDNLNLMNTNRQSRRQLAAFTAMGKILGSSLLNSELLHALLQAFHQETPFSVAVVMQVQEQTPNQLSVIDILSTVPLNVGIGSHEYAGSLLEGVIRQGNILSLNNAAQLRHPLELELAVKPGLASLMLVPLKMGGKVTGLLMLGDVRADAFDGMEEKAETAASLLALAMEKTRLSGSVTKRDQEMESIKQIGSILAAATFDRQEVFKHTMDMIRTIMNVEAGSLLLIEDGELAFKVAFNSNPACDTAMLESLRVRLGQGIAGYAAARGEPVIVCDTRDSRQFAPEFDRKTGFETRSILCVPLISRGRVLGVIEVINKLNDGFHDGDLHLLQSIATSVSIALENSQLYQETLSMAAQERGIRNMFQKFVPREIVDKIIHQTETERLVPEELKILTLLNIDIRGFSTLSKKIGPQRTVAILNHFFAAMGELVFKHQGIVDKYLGDGFLAVFGAPVSGAGDADHAIAAALEMKASLAQVNEHFAEELEEPLSMGISLHTGEAVVGNIGFEKKMDYTVIGDSVNAVFRLQDLTKSRPNSILISEKTKSAAMNSILDLRDIGVCDAGSTLGELKIFELLGAHPRGTPLS